MCCEVDTVRQGKHGKYRLRAPRRVFHVLLCLVIVLAGLFDGLSHNSLSHYGHEHGASSPTIAAVHAGAHAHTDHVADAHLTDVVHDTSSYDAALFQIDARDGEEGECRGDGCAHVCMSAVIQNNPEVLCVPLGRNFSDWRGVNIAPQGNKLPYRPPIISL